ncbi:MAG: RecX family transcriptional regulator [Bacteroidales bacterium]|nr:RecX family transcriptional regulator [Bacteroidales bacterium]
MATNTPSEHDKVATLCDRARRYCSISEQCEDAVRQKLVAWGATSLESDTVVERLSEEGYLDNERYARAYCESKILTQHWGRQKVIYQLRLKRLPRQTIETALAAVGEEQYSEALQQAAQKKWSELGDKVSDTFQRKQKLTAFLAAKGFTLSEINQVIINNLNL